MTLFLTRVRSFLKRHLLLALFTLLVLLLGTGYLLGYRPGPGFTFVRAGTLVLSGLPEGATVYADETKRAVSHGTDVRIMLVPGNHSIIVDAKDTNPWNDVITIIASQNTISHPLLVPLSVDRVSLPQDERTKATATLAAYQLPDIAHALTLEHGCANVYVSENRVVASTASSTTCAPLPYLCVGGTCATTVVFAPVAELHSVMQYPGREDAVIVGYGDTLAVIELNPLKPQFFAPLVQGVAPLAAPWDATRIIVRDDNRTFSITL